MNHTALLLVLLLPTAALPARAVSVADSSTQPSAEPVRIQILPDTDGALTLRLTTDARVMMLKLQRNTTLEAQAARFVPQIARGQQRLYHGHVERAPASWLRLSHVPAGWSGVVFDGHTAWHLSPTADIPANAASKALPAGAHVMYRAEAAGGQIDLRNDALPGPLPPVSAPSDADTGARTKGVATYNLGLSLVLDIEYQSRFPDATSRAAAILNVIDGYYQRTTNTSVHLNELQLLPAGDAGMTASGISDLLTQFTAYVTTPAAPDFHAATHLITGKNSIGTGLAWVDTLCDPEYAAGVSAGKYDIPTTGAIVAHELGHNYGAEHDGSGSAAACPNGTHVMETVITIGAPSADFSSCSIARFAQRAANTFACLRQELPFVFRDGFEN